MSDTTLRHLKLCGSFRVIRARSWRMRCMSSCMRRVHIGRRSVERDLHKLSSFAIAATKVRGRWMVLAGRCGGFDGAGADHLKRWNWNRWRVI